MDIIGFSCCLPESKNSYEFWDNLISGTDMVKKTNKRFPTGINQIPERMGIMPDIETFDNMLFGINSKQAEKMDPQIRLSLENTFGCIIDSGIDPQILRGRSIGVYSGGCFSDSMQSQLSDPDRMDGREMVGNALSMIANRVSFFFDFKGPSCNFDTACSSSLVALDKAFTDLNDDIVEFAVVIGSSLCLNPGGNVGFAKYNMLSPNGKCSSFDSSADGYARSEGSIAILLKNPKVNIPNLLNENLNYYAKVLGTGVNSDGYTERGITYPSHEAQTNLYKQIYQRYNIDSKKITYIEAHGTGTVAGDKQELTGMLNFFKQKIMIGSVKSNMGHCEGCSGLAGLLKVLLSIKNGIIPKNLHYNNPNEYIVDNPDKFTVVDKNLEWSGGIVGINSFGFGGTNAHTVIEGYTPTNQDRFFVSEYNQKQFRGIIGFDKAIEIQKSNDNQKYCYVYTGMGSNYLGMGLDLLEDQIAGPILQRCHKHLLSIDNKINLIDCYKNIIHQDTNKIYSMLMLTSLQIALTEILNVRYGIKVSYVIGHSAGEVAAGYGDGILSVEECIGISYARGASVDSLDQFDGLMVAVGLSFEDTEIILIKLFGKDFKQRIVVGCDNSPTAVTVSGYDKEVIKFINYCQENNIFAKEVRTDGVAFHSPQITKITDKAKKFINKQMPKRNIVRNKKWISTAENYLDQYTYNTEYVMSGFTKCVNFRTAIGHLPENVIVIEIGPAGLLKKPILDSNPKIKYVACQKYNSPALKGLKLMREILWLNHGLPLENLIKKGAMGILKSQIVDSQTNVFPTIDPSLWVPKHIPSAKKDNNSEYMFSREICGDHLIDGRILVPATGMIVSIWETYEKIYNKSSPIEITDLKINRALVFDENEESLKVIINMNEFGDFYLTNINNEIVASGVIKDYDKKIKEINCVNTDNNHISFVKKDFYQLLRSRGYQYQEKFQCVNFFDGNNAKIQFLNWTSYLDCMLQCLLPVSSSDSDQWELGLPTGIDSIILDPLALNSCNELDIKIIPPSYSYIGGSVQSSCAIIKGLKKTSAPRNNPMALEFFKEVKHIPYGKHIILNNQSTEYANLCHKYLSYRIKSHKLDLKSQIIPFITNKIDKDIESKVVSQLNIENHILLKIIHELDINKYFKDPLGEINKHPLHQILYQKDLFMSMCPEILYICLQIIIENIKELSFFEIGSGTGGMTKIIIDTLKTYPDLNYNFMASDYFKGYLPKLKEIDKNITTVIYDINEPLEENKYNCIFAMNALHICKNIENCVNNLFDSLMNGGFILVQEGCSNIITLFWGMADSSWNFNDSREKGLWTSNKEWERIFKKIGFEIVMNYSTCHDMLSYFLLYKPFPTVPKKINLNYKDISNIQNQIDKKDIIVAIVEVKNKSENTGIVGFIKSINKEPDTPKIIMNHPTSQLTMNIVKNGQNGFYARSDFLFGDSNNCNFFHENGVSMNFKQLGDLTTRYWVAKRPPKYDENIKVNVSFSALNFKDVMLSYGKLNKDAILGFTKDGFIGFEMSGKVEERRVMGFALNSIANIVHTKENMIWDVPDDWTLAEAATVPTVYATAYYSLIIRGNLKRKESVLIHAGTGGVGLAAITIALSMDCNVFTTCSTEEKTKFLLKRFPKLNSLNIGYSRDSSFEEMIMSKTNNQGVNLVLNSFSGELMHASLRCVAKHGHFIEIGKYDLINNTKIGLQPFISNISYHAIDLDQVFSSGKIWTKIYNGVSKLLTNKIIKPLPFCQYSFNDIDKAMNYLASGKNTGKVIVNFENFEVSKIENKFYADKNITYIIHGGLGGFGLIFMRWLVDRGAKNIIITSRSGIKTGEEQYHIDFIKKKKVNIIVFKGDIGDPVIFKSFKKTINKFPKVDGVFIMSMILKDRLFINMSQEEWDTVIKCKIEGAKNLDNWTRDNKVNHFISWSSIASGFGNSGQTNYSYGNSFLDDLIQNRINQGLSGLSIQWGVIGDVGAVSRKSKINSLSTIAAQPILRCLDSLDALLSNNKHGIFTNYMYEKYNVNHEEEDISLVKLTCNLIGVEYSDKIKNTELSDLGIDSLIGTNLQNMFNKKGIKMTIDEINKLSLEQISLIST